MQTLKVTNDVEIAYRDSGAPPGAEVYHTVIIFHGHTYHSAVFKLMLAAAPSQGYRLIAPNRRLYPGSTPYTVEEEKALGPSNSPEVNVAAMVKQGEYLLRFVDKLIVELNLQDVTICGWSLGTPFLNGIVCSISDVDAEIRARMSKHVKNVVWWEPPYTNHGFPDPPSGAWHPLYDETIPKDQRGLVFANWVLQYYPQKDLDKRDYRTLVYKVDEPIKPGTFADMPMEEVLQLIELSAGPAGDRHISDPHIQPAHKVLREKAFFDPEVRSLWGNPKFIVMFGEETTYNIVWTVWKLEERAEQTGLPIVVKSMPGANHFPMHDQPELSASLFQSFF